MADLGADRRSSAWTASVRRRRPGTASGRIQICFPSVRPPGLTAQYATVVIPTPPAACARWNSIVVGYQCVGRAPSKVADLIVRLRNEIGPSLAG